MNLLYSHYDIPIIRKEKATDPYLSQSAASLFYRLLWKNWILFGEAGLTFSNTTRVGKALITGCMISLSRYVDLSGALYYYGLYAPYGNGFKRHTTDHEKGGYACLQLTPLPSWQIITSGHFFATLSPKPQLAIASSGHHFTTRSHYTWNRATILVMQHKLHKNPRNKPKEANCADQEKVAQATQNSLKFKVDHKLTHYWWAHAEVQYTRYTFLGHTHHGYALANTQKWKGSKCQFACKAIFFKTEEYATRLYFYLPSPLYSGTQFYPYYGNGIAATWLVCWRPIDLVRLEIRYSFIYPFDSLSRTETTRTNRSSKGKHDGTIQLLVKF